MNWADHNVVFKQSKYDIHSMILKNGSLWAPKAESRRALLDLMVRLGTVLAKKAKRTVLTVKVNKGGLALRGGGTSDFCWVNLRTDDAVVQWNDNLFINYPAKMKGLDRYAKSVVSNQAEVASAVDFCVRAEQVTSA